MTPEASRREAQGGGAANRRSFLNRAATAQRPPCMVTIHSERKLPITELLCGLPRKLGR